MSHLPLLCKGCSQPLNVPDPTPDPPKTIEELPPPSTTTVFTSVRESINNDTSTASLAKDKTAALGAKPVSSTENIERKSRIDPMATGGHDRVEVPETTFRIKPLFIAVDAAIGLVLLVLGGLLGEILASKSTGDVWREAGYAPKFPPIDLLMWLAPPLLMGLIYGWLVARRKSIGYWLQKRNAT